MVFCPKCGTQQALDDMRFCSRCGLSLNGLVGLIQADSLAPIVSDQDEGQSLYKRATKHIGAKIIFLSLVLIPFSFLLAIAFDSPGPFLLPGLTFILGVAHLAYKMIFGESPHSRSDKIEVELSPKAERFGLPSSLNHPFWTPELKRDTAELVPPPSVTERTTNLLKHEEDL